MQILNSWVNPTHWIATSHTLTDAVKLAKNGQELREEYRRAWAKYFNMLVQTAAQQVQISFEAPGAIEPHIAQFVVSCLDWDEVDTNPGLDQIKSLEEEIDKFVAGIDWDVNGPPAPPAELDEREPPTFEMAPKKPETKPVSFNYIKTCYVCARRYAMAQDQYVCAECQANIEFKDW